MAAYERRASDACFELLAKLDARGAAATILQLTQDMVELTFGSRVPTDQPEPALTADDAAALDAIRAELRRRELTPRQRGRVLADLCLRAIATGGRSRRSLRITSAEAAAAHAART